MKETVLEHIRTGMIPMMPVPVGYVPAYISEEISDEAIMNIINTHADSLVTVNEYIKTGKLFHQNKDGKKYFIMPRYAREINVIRKHIQKNI